VWVCRNRSDHHATQIRTRIDLRHGLTTEGSALRFAAVVCPNHTRQCRVQTASARRSESHVARQTMSFGSPICASNRAFRTRNASQCVVTAIASGRIGLVTVAVRIPAIGTGGRIAIRPYRRRSFVTARRLKTDN